MMSKLQILGVYVFNKVFVKYCFGYVGGNQSDVLYLLNQFGGVGEDCQIFLILGYLKMIYSFLNLKIFLKFCLGFKFYDV